MKHRRSICHLTSQFLRIILCLFLVFAKDNKKLQNKGKTDLTKEEFIKWSNALWTFAPEKKQKGIIYSNIILTKILLFK